MALLMHTLYPIIILLFQQFVYNLTYICLSVKHLWEVDQAKRKLLGQAHP